MLSPCPDSRGYRKIPCSGSMSSPPTAEARARLGSEGGRDPLEPPPPHLGVRARSRSAPPALWAARRFGRQLRRMSDEFQQEVLPRANSAGGGRGWLEALRRWWGAPPPPSPPRPPP